MELAWKPLSERSEFGRQPIRQFVLVHGARHHSGVAWDRRHWGLAYICKPGTEDEAQQYRRSDIDQILKDGDMDYGEVTHWMPAVCPKYPPARETRDCVPTETTGRCGDALVPVRKGPPSGDAIARAGTPGTDENNRKCNEMNEKQYAVVLANRVLDRINADPDADLAVLSRQYLRAREALERIAENASDFGTRNCANHAIG